MTAAAFAPAKLNLFLHVGPASADGYHPVCSLMAFADVGDRVQVAPAERDELLVTGPFARDLAATAPQDNLVRRAADALLARAGAPGRPLRIVLHKTLPVAAGLGGGSSDAAAVLRLVRDLVAPDLPDAVLMEVAAGLGADGPACLAAEPVIAEGRGERLSPAPRLPPLHAVLVNPGAACPTGAVYLRYDDQGAPGRPERPSLPDAFDDVDTLVAALAACRNDLEAPAADVAPVVAESLELLRGQPEALLARLSGSGATAFALARGAGEAERLAARIAALRPGWWVRACRVGGPWPEGAGASP